MKIAHISDLHLDAVYKQENYCRTIQLLEYISDTGFDHIVITGDVTENAETSALKLARNILKRFGLLKSEKCTIIIGNHDIFGGVHLTEDLMNFPKKCRLTNYQKKVSEFTSAFSETYSQILSSSSENIYPFIKEFDDFILVGFNSIAEYSTVKNPFASNGKISEKQINIARELIRISGCGNKKVIALSHHHFSKSPILDKQNESQLWQKIENHTMKLRDKKRIIGSLTELNTVLVLHGHVHETTEYSRKQIKFLNAGASVSGPENSTHGFHIINSSSSGFDTHMHSLSADLSRILPSAIRKAQHKPLLPAFDATISLN